MGWTETVPEAQEMRPAWSGGSSCAKESVEVDASSAAQAVANRNVRASGRAKKRIGVDPFVQGWFSSPRQVIIAGTAGEESQKPVVVLITVRRPRQPQAPHTNEAIIENTNPLRPEK
jgi:hypothetical protein